MKSIAFLLFCLVFVLNGCKTEQKKNSGDIEKSESPLESLIGTTLDMDLPCFRPFKSTAAVENYAIDTSFHHSVVLYISEGMCTNCIQDAFNFLKDELNPISPSQIRIVSQYSNSRTPSVLLKLFKVQYQLCNIDMASKRLIDADLEKPVFLVVDSSLMISNFFQLKDEMIDRMRASLYILTR